MKVQIFGAAASSAYSMDMRDMQGNFHIISTLDLKPWQIFWNHN